MDATQKILELPVTDEELAVVQRRLETLDEDAKSAVSWSEVKKRFVARKISA